MRKKSKVILRSQMESKCIFFEVLSKLLLELLFQRAIYRWRGSLDAWTSYLNVVDAEIAVAIH